MTEAPDVYPDFPDDDDPGESGESDDQGVEGVLHDDAIDHQVRTGDPRVDGVLDSLAGLDERPLAEHAAVFERAHDGLRAALDPDREPA